MSGRCLRRGRVRLPDRAASMTAECACLSTLLLACTHAMSQATDCVCGMCMRVCVCFEACVCVETPWNPFSCMCCGFLSVLCASTGPSPADDQSRTASAAGSSVTLVRLVCWCDGWSPLAQSACCMCLWQHAWVVGRQTPGVLVCHLCPCTMAAAVMLEAPSPRSACVASHGCMRACTAAAWTPSCANLAAPRHWQLRLLQLYPCGLAGHHGVQRVSCCLLFSSTTGLVLSAAPPCPNGPLATGLSGCWRGCTQYVACRARSC